MAFKIKTLAEIATQCDRIADSLSKQGRISAECRVYDIYTGIFGRVLDSLGVIEIDDESLEWIMEEPLVVGVSY